MLPGLFPVITCAYEKGEIIGKGIMINWAACSDFDFMLTYYQNEFNRKPK